MLFRIRHSLHYRYDRPVFLEPLTVRLTPRQDSSQRLLHHILEVEAAPSGRSAGLDADGNASQVVWFDDLRERLDLIVTMEVETQLDNPFDWIITDPAVARLPARYDAATALSLSSFLPQEPVDPAVAAWAAELAAGVGQATVPFLMAITDGIHHGFHHVGRPDGDPMEPAETLAGRSGACRDTAMLYVAACRSQGLAAT